MINQTWISKLFSRSLDNEMQKKTISQLILYNLNWSGRNWKSVEMRLDHQIWLWIKTAQTLCGENQSENIWTVWLIDPQFVIAQGQNHKASSPNFIVFTGQCLIWFQAFENKIDGTDLYFPVNWLDNKTSARKFVQPCIMWITLYILILTWKQIWLCSASWHAM